MIIMLVNLIIIVSLALIVWRAEISIAHSHASTPLLFRASLVLLCVGGLSIIWLAFQTPLEWPLAVFSVGAATFVMLDRREKTRGADNETKIPS